MNSTKFYNLKIRVVGSNQTELTINKEIILFSYQTPVAVMGAMGNFKTEKYWSKTTSRHVNKFFLGLQEPTAKPQKYFDDLLIIRR